MSSDRIDNVKQMYGNVVGMNNYFYSKIYFITQPCRCLLFKTISHHILFTTWYWSILMQVLCKSIHIFTLKSLEKNFLDSINQLDKTQF